MTQIYIYATLGIVALGALCLWLMRKAAEAQGRAEAEAESAKKVVHAGEVRAQVDSGNNALSTDALRDKLLNDKR